MEGVEKGPKIGGAQRKRLADISNLQQSPKPVSQNVKQLPISHTTKEYIEKLQKENMTLMKLLGERTKIIELSGIEIQKLRINLQKVQHQNLQLAQANSQMLALKALQHELGCKNGLLKVGKIDLEIKAKRLIQNTGNEIGTAERDKVGESSQADRGDLKPSHTSRRRQSKSQSLAPTTVNEVHAKETVENKSRHLRRQSARFKSEEPEPTADLFEIDKAAGPTTVKPVQAKENIGNKRLSILVHDSVRLRCCLRRQSARFRSAEPERTEELFEIDEAKFPVSARGDDVVHSSGPTSSGISAKEKDEGNTAVRLEAQEIRRSSVGRPLRRAAEKVQSYKEIPVNVKLRRQD
ncbi:Shugoshin-1 [Morella rubra]|uniref:Shugoshin-1 n=1 Tax=Morella rubra TaxID=262757 RepID=A0A6A1W1E2_9ROSI|nr:Shugoshin-1 [Morella rubra]